MLSLSRSAARASLRDDDSDTIEDWRRRWRRCEPLQRMCGTEYLLELAASVGEQRDNRRRDVAKAQLILERLGLYDLERVEGPTGYLDHALLQALRRFQSGHGVTVDGWMRPDGPTQRAMYARLQPVARRDAVIREDNLQSRS